MIRKYRFLILSSLMLFSAVPGTVFARPGDMRRAYEDGWKWYLYRKSQGANDGELFDILQTLKDKYGQTYFNLQRVDRALEELDGRQAALPEAAPPPEVYPAASVHEVVRHAAKDIPASYAPADAEPEAVSEPKSEAADETAEISAPAQAEPRPAAAKSATPAAQEESGDPFERYMASQRAKVYGAGAKAEQPAAKTSAAQPAAQKVPAPQAASKGNSPAAVLTNKMAQSKIDELASPDEMTRVKAAQSLGEMKEPGAVGPLIQLLGGDSTFASMAASTALAKIGKPAVQPLINALQDPNPNVRIGACVALGDMKDPAIAPALEKASLDKDSRVRRAASAALNKVKSAK